jgi:hypothetical protein
MEALSCKGVLQQEHQERAISLCIQALQIHGALPARLRACCGGYKCAPMEHF